MKEIPKSPPLDEAVIQWLEAVFPGRIPSDSAVPHRELDQMIGQQQVIRRLREEYKRQLKNIVEE